MACIFSPWISFMSSDQYLTEILKNSLGTRGICVSVAEYCSTPSPFSKLLNFGHFCAILKIFL